ncbi:DUF21 domain-containing protein At1g55930, chloroplastic-like isoform X1 [Silene latifolia]|uniref:DUF21 domain-containing protein At1g55930, chloroplastic-like isoform X1 n=1 Tax=Silene latifolia TaxID=37657 RepID=UPI003D76FCA3
MLSTLNPSSLNPLKLTNLSQFSPIFQPFPKSINYPYKFSIPQIRPISCNFKNNSLKGFTQNSLKFQSLKKWGFIAVVCLIKGGIFLGLMLGCSIIRCSNVFAMENGILGGGNVGFEGVNLMFQKAWPVILKILGAFKEHGVVLGILLGLSAFFSMAETSITTLWPWKVRELAEKDTENGVFKMLRNDVTRFLTTILIGTTVVNIAATALVTEAATTLFGEAGVSAATGVMTVAILLLTEITPKSIAVHHPTEVVKFVVRPVAWLSLVLYPVGRVVTYLSGRMLKLLGLKAESEPNVTEEELKLMLRVAELSGAIEEEEQDMIENVLEIKDTFVREVMTPLVDIIAIDADATLMDFHELWVLHQFSRVPVFEQRIDNIVGIAYAMDLLDILQKQEQLDGSVVRDVLQPAFFVPDSMSVWNLLREFRIRKVHMAVVLNEYGGTIGIVTMEDVVEEIVGEIFDENDSKEEIQKKTGYIINRGDGIFDVDASTSIYQLCEDLDITLPEDHQYETVSGFLCETFGCIPRAGESVNIVLDKVEREESNRDKTGDPHHTQSKEKYQTYKLEFQIYADIGSHGQEGEFSPIQTSETR